MPTVGADDPLTRSARRILIHGVTGSGKTTLARALGVAHGIPVIEVDALAWQPGWVKTPDADLAETAAAVAATDEWILDSAWSAIRPVALPRARNSSAATANPGARCSRGTRSCFGTCARFAASAHRSARGKPPLTARPCSA